MLQMTSVFALQPAGTDNADFQITTPGTITGDWTTDLEGMQSVAIELRFLYGSGGTSVKALVQTALGTDGPAFDIVQADFTTAARTVLCELYAGTTTLVEPHVGGFDSAGSEVFTEGLMARVLGDRLRLLLIVTGTYTNTTLTGRVIPK
jgi:hypothetical protein